MTAKQWLICFVDNAERHWWDVMTRPCFRHAFAVQHEIERDLWIVIDWSSGIANVDVLSGEQVTGLLQHVRDRQGVALMAPVESAPRTRGFRMPLTYCVTAILQLLGKPTRFTWTPYQLYKRLMREGALVIADNRDQTWDRNQSKAQNQKPQQNPLHDSTN